MAITQRRSLITRALSVSAVAIVATVLGGSAPIASAAPAAKTAVASFSSLDNAANWAIVKQAKAAGYPVSDKLSASCGAKQ